jgi:hypothetical protein
VAGIQGAVVACYQARLRTIARKLAAGLRADFANVFPSALARLEDDCEGSIICACRSPTGAS